MHCKIEKKNSPMRENEHLGKRNQKEKNISSLPRTATAWREQNIQMKQTTTWLVLARITQLLF